MPLVSAASMLWAFVAEHGISSADLLTRGLRVIADSLLWGSGVAWIILRARGVGEATGGATELRFAAIVGAVVDRSSYRDILRRNVGGVKGSGFYFAVMDIDDVDYLTVDTKLLLDRHTTLDTVTSAIEAWVVHPLLTRTWNFPSGVVNMLWDASTT